MRGKFRRFMDRTAFNPAPVVTDNFFHLAFALLWLMYAAWAFATIAIGLGSITNSGAPDWLAFGYRVFMFLTTTGMFFSAVLRLEKWEYALLWAFNGALAGYGVILSVAAISRSEAFAVQAILVASFLVMPLFRMRFLNKRLRGKAIAEQQD